MNTQFMRQLILNVMFAIRMNRNCLLTSAQIVCFHIIKIEVQENCVMNIVCIKKKKKKNSRKQSHYSHCSTINSLLLL